jgi:hypothetical protein
VYAVRKDLGRSREYSGVPVEKAKGYPVHASTCIVLTEYRVQSNYMYGIRMCGVTWCDLDLCSSNISVAVAVQSVLLEWMKSRAAAASRRHALGPLL